MAGSEHRYRFGPLERRGLIAGWRGGQIAAAAAGVALAVWLLSSHPDAPRLLGGVGAVGAGLAAAWWPLHGRTAEEWAPTVARWALSPGRRPRAAGVVSKGHCAGPDGQPCLAGVPTGADRAPSGPARGGPRSRVWGGLRILSATVPPATGELGIVADRQARTWTAVLEVLGHSFALLGGEEKERRVAAWGAVLASFARAQPVVHRLQWVVATIPDDGDAVAAHMATGAVLPPGSLARRSYSALLDGAGAETTRHEVLLAVQLRAGGAGGRALRAAGGGDRAAAAVLGRELVSLRRQLSSADIPVERVLDARGLAAVIRRAGRSTQAAGGCPPCGTGWPWPLSCAPEWGCVRTDGAWHATYWIAEWPRTDVGPEFLAPLLLASQRRTVSVVMEPVDPARAVRRAERARTADIADEKLRRRGGFLTTARRAREAELAGRRETELADGHASFRFAGYVTVTAGERDELMAACDATEQAASRCGLELRRLYGEQERALACTMPLGRGLS